MVVTIMPSINSTFKKIRQDHPDLDFVSGEEFVWSAKNKTVTYGPLEKPEDLWSLLHEISHAILAHADFETDIELLGKEAEAWDYAVRVLAPQHDDVAIDGEYVQAQLDSYRDWLHKRSTCPSCRQTGIQNATSSYSCVNCLTSWRVNDARKCALRRYVQPI
jgi:hypothetical protein